MSAIKSSANLSNFQLFCPRNSMANYFNSSSKYLSGQFHINSEYFEMEIGWYGCYPCKNNQYSLSKGYLILTKEPNNFGFPTMRINSVHCHDCPFGGKCHNRKGLVSQPNYWGLVTDDKVNFYICPKSYCCSNHSCESYNGCENNRNGTLCGRCLRGYSESILSRKCIANERCDLWGYFLSVIVSTVICILFLTFNRDLKLFLFSSSKSNRGAIQPTNTKIRRMIKVKSTGHELKKKETTEVKFSKYTQTDQVHISSERNKDEGAIFLLLFCYYFQDIPLFTINGTYTSTDDTTTFYTKRILSDIFKLQLKVLGFFTDTCISSNMDPATKDFAKHAYLIVIFYSLSIFLHRFMSFRKRNIQTTSL